MPNDDDAAFSTEETKASLTNATLTVGFPVQSDNTYARAILGDEILKSRRLVVQADGALLVIPFENVKYLSIYPAPDELPAHTILGCSVDA
jgi:hypothetical protein